MDEPSHAEQEPREDETSHEAGAGLEGLTRAFEALARVLLERASDDAEVAAACRTLGRWLVEAGEAASEEALEGDVAGGGVEREPARVERTLSIAGLSVPVAVPDDRGVSDDGGGVGQPPPSPAAEATSPSRAASAMRAGLGTIVKRSRLKAECCRWAIERRRRLSDDVEFEQWIKPTDVELGGRLQELPNCYGWPLDPYASLPEDRILDDAGGCYEALADAVELAERVRGDEELFESWGKRAYELLAECCSALRSVLLECDIGKDADQDDAFDWLRARAFDDRVYIERHMRLDDPADFTQWPARREEIERLGDDISARHAHAKEIRNLIGRVGYISKRWGDYAGEEAVVQARKLADAVERLAQLGVRPSDPRIRDPLLEIADLLPDEIEQGGAFSEALRFADEHAARREAESRSDDRAAPPPTPEVVRARDLLSGKVAVLIGGTCRPRSRDALREGLGLSELRWITTRPHEPLSHFDAQARRDDVALVMLAIRWASHSFEDIKAVCDGAGTPFVRLPRGYGLNQVAREIVSQASESLGEG